MAMTIRLILAALCATTLAACSSSSSGGTTRTSTPPAGVPTGFSAPPSSARSSVAPVITPIGATLWWNQFEITLKQSTFTRDGASSPGGVLAVTGTLKNLTDQARALAGGSDQPALTVGGTSVSVQGPLFHPVPAGGTADLALNYRTDVAFDPASSTLTFGSTDELQSSAKLTAGGAIQTVKPKAVSPGGSGKTSVLALAVTGGTADASYRALDKGKYVLRLAIDATYSGTASGGYYFSADQFTIDVGGAKIASTSREPNDLSATPIPAGATTVHTFVSFLLPDPPPDAVTVTYDGKEGNGAIGTAALKVVVS
jgi:hypothetical protein